MNDAPWEAIFAKYNLTKFDFASETFVIEAEQIKQATHHFRTTTEKEVRILCKQDTREQRPKIFRDLSLFLLPIKNGSYAIVQGEGYVDIPPPATQETVYHSKLDFRLETSQVGDSEMQHLDFAYAASAVRTFMQDESLVLTIRGRKYTGAFSFRVGNFSLTASSVQTEVDAGYEGRNQVVLIEAKSSRASNTIIRQLYYPFRQWSPHTTKKVHPLFFEKQGGDYCFWQFEFTDEQDYNSIKLVKSGKYKIQER